MLVFALRNYTFMLILQNISFQNGIYSWESGVFLFKKSVNIWLVYIIFAYLHGISNKKPKKTDINQPYNISILT